jgi:hypothetical protein
MRLPKDNVNRKAFVLLAGAIAGGLYGLLRAMPSDLNGIIRVSAAYAVLGLIAAYWVFVWLRPRSTRRTLVGAMTGAAVLVSVFFVFPTQYLSNRVFAIIDSAFVGAFVGALFGTAPRGASIGAGAGALVGFVFFFAIFWFIERGEYRSIPWSIIIYGTFFWLLVGVWIGASRELDRRSKVSKPHS